MLWRLCQKADCDPPATTTTVKQPEDYLPVRGDTTTQPTEATAATVPPSDRQDGTSTTSTTAAPTTTTTAAPPAASTTTTTEAPRPTTTTTTAPVYTIYPNGYDPCGDDCRVSYYSDRSDEEVTLTYHGGEDMTDIRHRTAKYHLDANHCDPWSAWSNWRPFNGTDIQPDEAVIPTATQWELRSGNTGRPTVHIDTNRHQLHEHNSRIRYVCDVTQQSGKTGVLRVLRERGQFGGELDGNRPAALVVVGAVRCARSPGRGQQVS